MPLSQIDRLISVVCTPVGLVHVQTRFIVQGNLEEYLPDWWIEAQAFQGGYRVVIWNKKKKWEFVLRVGQSATVVYEGGYIFKHTELNPSRAPARILDNVLTGKSRTEIHPGYRTFFKLLQAQ